MSFGRGPLLLLFSGVPVNLHVSSAADSSCAADGCCSAAMFKAHCKVARGIASTVAFTNTPRRPAPSASRCCSLLGRWGCIRSSARQEPRQAHHGAQTSRAATAGRSLRPAGRQDLQRRSPTSCEGSCRRRGWVGDLRRPRARRAPGAFQRAAHRRAVPRLVRESQHGTRACHLPEKREQVARESTRARSGPVVALPDGVLASLTQAPAQERRLVPT